MKTNELSIEEREARLRKRLANYNPSDAKPKPVPALTVPVSPAFAEAATANPASVRVSATRRDGVTMVERPQVSANCVRVCTDYVYEVNAAGQPVWEEVGVVSDYNPLDRL